MWKIAKYIFWSVFKSRFLIAYTLFLFFIANGFFMFESDNSKAITGLLSIVLTVVPLVTIIFTTIYFYNSTEFLELLLAQPISRATIFFGEVIGVSVAMLSAFIIGIGIPILFYSVSSINLTLIGVGGAQTLIFVAIAFLASVLTRDKAKGIGLSLMCWFYFAIIYDAIVLAILFAFNDYPLDSTTIILSTLNPIDLSRIIVLMQLDVSALMGFTGALYKSFFGDSLGILIALFGELLWLFLPVILAFRVFKKRDW